MNRHLRQPTGSASAPVDSGASAGGECGNRSSVTILGIVGSLRRDSYNRKLLNAAAVAVPDYGHMVLWERLREIPPFNEDDEANPPASVAELCRQIAEADAVLIATPEYNGSMPGQLKNALDWASRPYKTNVLREKVVAVIGASPSPGGTIQANTDARRILSRIGARVIMERVLVSHAFDKFRPDGTLADQRLKDELAGVVSSLVAAAAMTAGHDKSAT